MNTTLREVVPQLQYAGISPQIIERVIRLNPNVKPGERLRGIHLQRRERDLMFGQCGAISKGEIIRRFGRDVFDQIPKSEHRKCGRRVWVGRRAVSAAYAILPPENAAPACLWRQEYDR